MISRSLLRNSRAVRCPAVARPSFAPIRSQFLQPLAAPSVSCAPSRWYSEAARAEQKENAEKSEPTKENAQAEGTGASEIEALKKQLETAKSDLEAKSKEGLEWKDKFLRSVADFRNLQERTKREVQAAKDFALQRFAKDLVESVDNFDRALGTVPAEKLVSSSDAPGNQELINLHSGLKMTEGILLQTLKKHGLERFDPSEQSEKFNPNMHEAVFQTPMPGKENDTCFHTQQKGFLLNGRVLRAAKVGVVKNS